MTPVQSAVEPGSEPPATDLTHAAFSIQGNRRRENGDRYLVNGRMAMVADGISSSRLGAEAAETCVSEMQSIHEQNPAAMDPSIIRNMLERINGRLLSNAMALGGNERRRGGCCVAGIVLDEQGGTATVFHAGDASVHVFGSDGLRKLTVDHNGSEKLDRQSRIRSALGVVPSPEIETRQIRVNPEEFLILATDGCDLENGLSGLDVAGGISPESVATHIRQATGEPRDDATVVIVRAFSAD